MDNSIISQIINPPFGNLILVLKISAIGFSLLFIACIIFFLSNTRWLRIRAVQDIVEISTFKPLGAKKVIKQWLKIKEKLESGLEPEFKLAIIEADSILDDVFKKIGYGGETLGERLKQVKVDILPSIEMVSEAHKIRNSIIHDPDYRLSREEAEKAILSYEKALTELDFL